MISLNLALFSIITFPIWVAAQNKLAAPRSSAPSLPTYQNEMLSPQLKAAGQKSKAESLKVDFSKVISPSPDRNPLSKLNSGGVGGGGGTTVIQNGNPVFRDLIGSCKWISGTDFVNQYSPQVSDVIQLMHQSHWYFARSLKAEIMNLQICLSPMPLKIINVNDRDGFTVFTEKYDQVAIREGNQVWLDLKMFEKMVRNNPLSATALTIHETLHSYLPWSTTRRNDRLRSMTNFLVTNFMAAPRAAELALNISANEIQIFPSARQLLISEPEYLTLADESQTLRKRMAIAAKWWKEVAYTGPLMAAEDKALRTRIYELYRSRLHEAHQSVSTGQTARLKLALNHIGASPAEFLQPIFPERFYDAVDFRFSDYHFNGVQNANGSYEQIPATPFRFAILSANTQLVQSLLPHVQEQLDLNDLTLIVEAIRYANSTAKLKIFEMYKLILAQPKIRRLILERRKGERIIDLHYPFNLHLSDSPNANIIELNRYSCQSFGTKPWYCQWNARW